MRTLVASTAFSPFLLVLAFSQAQSGAPLDHQGTEQQVLGQGTRFETPWFDRRGEEDGPTILITGGMHGNEPAGAAAAEEISNWSVKKGRLVVVPRMNRPALAAAKRLIPDVPEDEGNLNRHFPIGAEVKSGIATDLWGLFEAVQPDWVLDIHEGFDFHRINSGSVGSSIISCADENAVGLAKKMIAAVDETIETEDRKFTLIRNPIPGSFARAAWENAGVPSMILETTFKRIEVSHRAGEQSLTVRTGVSYRARQHRLMVHTFLSELGMEPCSKDTLIDPDLVGERARVAIFDDGGTSDAKKMDQALQDYDGLVCRRVGSPDIHAGVLSQFDVVLHSGGSGSAQANALGEMGRAHEIDFIRGGGGFLGICAGGYLAACNYKWSLGVLDARTIDTKQGHWRRGRAELEIELTDAGLSLFGEREPSLDIQYVNGPIFAPGERDEIPDYEILAHFRGEVADNGTSTGVMPGTPAFIRGPFGKGRVVAFSPHPEKTESIQHFVHDAVLWASAGD